MDNSLIEKMVALANIKDTALAFLEDKLDSNEHSKLSDRYEKYVKSVGEYYLSLMDNVLALQNSVNAHKTMKVDPYIAGGAAQGVAGVGAGIYSAVKADSRNKDIDSWRKDADREVIETKTTFNSKGEQCAAEYNYIFSIVGQYPELVDFFNKELEKNKEAQKKVAEEKKQENQKIYLIVIAIVAIIAIIVFCGGSAIAAIAIAMVAVVVGIGILGMSKNKKEKVSNLSDEELKEKKNKTKRIAIISGSIGGGIAVILLFIFAGLPAINYSRANSAYNQGNYEKAAELFDNLGYYKDSLLKYRASEFNLGEELFEQGEYEAAIEKYELAGQYEGASERIQDARNMIEEEEQAAAYQEAKELLESGDAEKAYDKFVALKGYSDSEDMAVSCLLKMGDDAFSAGNYNDAISYYENADADEKVDEAKLAYAKANFNTTDADTRNYLVELAENGNEEARGLYAELYPSSAAMVANLDRYDTTTDKESYKATNTQYSGFIHYQIVSDDTAGTIPVRVTYEVFKNGEWRVQTDDEMYAEAGQWYMNEFFYYNDSRGSSKGRYTIYNEITGEEIGSKTLNYQ